MIIRPYCAFAGDEPAYPVLAVDFGDDEDAEGDGDGGLDGDEAGLQGGTQLVGDDVVAGPEDASAGHEREDAADEEDGDGTLAQDGLHESRQGDQGSSQEDDHSGRESRVAQQDQIEQPSQRAAESAGTIVPARHPEEDRKGYRADEGRQQLDNHPGGFRCGRKSIQLQNLSVHKLVDYEGHGDTQRDAEEGEQRIEEPRNARKVVFVGQIANTIGEGHSRDQRDDGPDDHIAQMGAESPVVHHNAEERGQESARDRGHDARQMAVTDEEHVDPQDSSGNQRRKGVGIATAEDDAEGCGAKGRSQDLLPDGLGPHGADLLETPLQLVEIALAIAHLSGELVDSDNLVEARPFDGDELGAGIAGARGHDAVAEDEEALIVHSVVLGDTPHGLLHSGDLGAVFQQYRPRLVGEVHDSASV